MGEWLKDHAGENSLYVTTRGRRTGRRHTIEIWFGTEGAALYLLSGGGAHSDWVHNLMADPAVSIRLGGETLAGRARLVSDLGEEGVARRLLAAKYQDWREPQPMSNWAATALVVAIDLTGGPL